ncbi:hypothetical protein [Trichormus variabilis]|uniref:Uncharacterized protein n=1 Tax=Trichormus variabilis SAG 1403-4b TaxID=447716 RepID=A0A3S1I9I5_ANAVA|nr:hypothetical protein [Trichormus variabilis]MBD2628735.1 hypothetical protein [Trichormus variabilis FACHB-164]RUS94060.1 hypothetical protein DSM107003_39470 [Trichormus variabilis SAG 1403-4b]
MFGFIKNLIGGILGFFTGLFRKKDNSYYLELKEEATETKPAAVKPIAATVTTSAPAATEKPAKEKPAKEKPAKAKSAKATKTEPAKAPAPKAEPAKPAVPTETTFAPKYLVPTASNVRRRPGANMNVFLDMATQVKTPG